MKFCCDKFSEQAKNQDHRITQFEYNNGTWNINGCCGGGCYVVSDMRFCPYCGAALTAPEVPHE